MMKKILFLFVLALALRVLFLISFTSHGDASFLATGDSETYLDIARNLSSHGSYASTPELIPDNHRPPLYPFFLVPFIASDIPLYIVAFVQDILVSVSVVLLYVFGRKIFSERAAFIAAIVFAVEPVGLSFSNIIMAEALFMIVFIPALFFLALYVKSRSTRDLILGAFFLALSALARSFAFYFFFLIPLVALIAQPKLIPWRPICIALILFFMMLMPWLWWNKTTFGSFQFSSTGSRNLYQDNATEFEKWLYPERQPFFTIENRERIVGEGKVQTVEGAHALGEVAKDFILEHPLKYAVFHSLYVPRLFMHDGYIEIYERLSGKKTALSQTPIYGDIITLQWRSVVDKIKKTPALVLPIIPKLFFIFIAILAFLHVFLSYRSGDLTLFYSSLFLTLFILVYAFFVSPVGQARLRLAIHPVLFLLAADSIRIFLSRRRDATRPAEAL